MGRDKRICYLSPMRAAKVQASLRIRAVSPEPSLLAHASSELRGTFRQKAKSLAPLNGWSCAVKICHDGMLEDTNSLGGAHMMVRIFGDGAWCKMKFVWSHSSIWSGADPGFLDRGVKFVKGVRFDQFINVSLKGYRSFRTQVISYPSHFVPFWSFRKHFYFQIGHFVPGLVISYPFRTQFGYFVPTFTIF